MLLDQFSKPESHVEFAYQNQAGIGSDARTLEIDLESGVKGELKRLLWVFTRWVSTSAEQSSLSHPHED